MVMMIQGHVLDSLVLPSEMDFGEFPWNFWNFCRRFTAPVFLMVSGMANVFANKRDDNGRLLDSVFRKRVKMGLILMGIGYFLRFPADKIYSLPFIEAQYWTDFFTVNILQLIGISIIFLALLYKATRDDKSVQRYSLAIALLITVASPFVHSVDWFEYLPEVFASYLSFKTGSYFPLFPYSAFLFYGVFFGTILKKIKPEKRNSFILKYSTITGAVLAAAIYPLYLYLGEALRQAGINPKANPALIFEQVAFVLIGLSFIALLFLGMKNLSKYYILFGKSALFVYVVHLLLLFGTSVFPSAARFYYKSLPLETGLIYAVAIELLTLGSAYAFMRLASVPAARALFRYSISAYIIYVLFI